MLRFYKKYLLVTILIFFISNSLFGQLGIRVGVNSASENFRLSHEGIKESFNSKSLSGYQIGLVYELNPKKSGAGFEIGALLSQRGGEFNVNNLSTYNSLLHAYHEINYVDIPLNLRLQFNVFGIFNLFTISGIYGSYALNGKTVFETEWKEIIIQDNFNDLLDRLEYGYNLGGGVEILRKIQLGISLHGGLQMSKKNKNIGDVIELENGVLLPNIERSKSNKSIAISLTYLL